MHKKDLHPPHSGPSANPVLYGIATGLAQLFPPIEGSGEGNDDRDHGQDGRDERSDHDGE